MRTDSEPSPAERVVAAAISCGWFCIVYNGCNYLTSLRSDVGVSMYSWEPLIPFVPAMIIPYWSIDVFFIVAFFVCTRRTELVALTRRVTTAITIAGIFFLLFPLKLGFTRPPVEGVLAPLFSSLENFNNFYNCAPSLHIALRTILWPVYISRTTGAANLLLRAWFLLIGLSTLLCWQHHLIDVITGQLLGLFVLHWIPEGHPVDPTIDPARRINGSYRLGSRYAGLATFFLLAAYASWPVGAILLWPALAFALVTAAYWRAGPRFFRKDSTGSLPPSTRWLLAPYLWAAELSYRYFTRNVRPATPVDDLLWFGRKLRRSERGVLSDRGITAVLDLTAEYRETAPIADERLGYLNVPVLDLTRPGVEQVIQAVSWIEDQRAVGPVFVHCSLGLGRSAAVVAAWLLASDRVSSVDDAIAEVRALEPRAVLTEGHRLTLIEFADRIDVA